MENHSAHTIEELIHRMEVKIEARKNGAEQAELTLYATVQDTLQSDPLFLELGALVGAYAAATPVVTSKIHSSHRHNPVRGYASTLLDVHSILLKDPQRWCNAEVSEEDVCNLHDRWFHYMEQAARVVGEWGCAERKTNMRPDNWFDSYMLSSSDDDRWLYYMKMCRHTFFCVSNRLQILSWREKFSSRPVVPVPVQLGATLYHLIHGADYETISDGFGIEVSAVQDILENCVGDLLRALGEYLIWPRSKAMQNVISGFDEHWLLDDCRGVLGTTRFNVTPPKFNGSVTHVVALQGVCDSTGLFLNISCAHPGSLSDSEVLRASKLYERASRGLMLEPSKVSNESDAATRPYLLASQTYEPLPWLLLSNDEASDEDDFYYRIMMAKSCISRAFKDLRRDFRCLRSGILCELSKAPAVIHVCCILHNFLYLKEDRPVRPSRNQLLSSWSDCESNNEDSESEWESEDGEKMFTTSCTEADEKGLHQSHCSRSL